MGDRVTAVGTATSLKDVEKILGNSMMRLRQPNLVPIFLGIFLGVLAGSVPFFVPGIPQPIKLGLAGGPLIVSILLSRFGPKFKLVTYTTVSANLMVREIGIAIFLAGVGLGAGKDFVSTVINGGGYVWIAYGAAITVLPVLIGGAIARVFFEARLFYPYGRAFRKHYQPSGARIFKRGGRQRHARRGICDGLSADHVPPRSDRAAADNFLRVGPRSAA